MSWEDTLKKRDMYVFPKAQEYLDNLDKDLDTFEHFLKEENGGWRKNKNKLMVLLDTSYMEPDFERELDMLVEQVKRIHDKDAKIREMPEMDEFSFALENERGETESGYHDNRFD
jgi:flagellar biosynthesis chaperone FliJ